jgi:hypothetical protein
MSIPIIINGDSQTMASIEEEFGTTHSNWTDATTGAPDGGVSCGIGFVISWQRGPLSDGRNGAFLLEVLSACQSQLEYYQTGQFASTENELALDNLKTAIAHLERRLDRRKAEGVLGTHEPDAVAVTVQPAIAVEVDEPGVTILPTEETSSCELGPK